MPLGCAVQMDEPRFLPFLASACRELLGDDDYKQIPAAPLRKVAYLAGVHPKTVERFLTEETVPRAHELDEMVDAVAAATEKDWTAPWDLASRRARESTEAKLRWEKFLTSGEPFDFAPKDSGEPQGEKRRHPR